MENEDVVVAAPGGDAPNTSEWSTIQLPAKVRLILQTWLYFFYVLRFYVFRFSSAADIVTDSQRSLSNAEPSVRRASVRPLNFFQID